MSPGFTFVPAWITVTWMINKFFPYLESWSGGGAAPLWLPVAFGAMAAWIVLSILRRPGMLLLVALPLLIFGLLHPLFYDLGIGLAWGPRLGALGAVSLMTGIAAEALLGRDSRRSRVLGAVCLAAAALGAGAVPPAFVPGTLVVAALGVFFALILLAESAARSSGKVGRTTALRAAVGVLSIGIASVLSVFLAGPLPAAAVQGLGICIGLLVRRGGRTSDAPAGTADAVGAAAESESAAPIAATPEPAGTEAGAAEEPADEPAVEAEEPLLSDFVDKVSLALTRFIPKEFLAILDRSSVVELQLGDHVKREMTIFFSDIRQFTNLSERLTPEESFKFINSYLSRIVPVITACGGFVDKYMGDAVMALFANEGGADAAVRAAIEMQKKIVEYNGHRANCGYRPLSMGIGLHTGTLMLGVVGVEDRMQNTVISDAVNLASRLESITKVFNISLAISEETFKNLEDPGSYMYRFIGKVRVKGKAEPVSVFEIFDGVDPDILERKMRANIFFEQGMLSYYRKDFTEAMFNFRKVLEVLPEDGASAFYLDNCMVKVRA